MAFFYCLFIGWTCVYVKYIYIYKLNYKLIQYQYMNINIK